MGKVSAKALFKVPSLDSPGDAEGNPGIHQSGWSAVEKASVV